MATAPLKLFTTVPAPEHPGAPILICYENGDWEFTYAKEADYVTGVVMSENVASILSEVSMDFGGDEMDQVDGNSLIELDITVTSAGAREDVLGIFLDGEFAVMDRSAAEAMIELEQDIFNFIPLTDFMDEFSRYVQHHRSAMFEQADEAPLDLGELFGEE